jgi:hypothetical protein
MLHIQELLPRYSIGLQPDWYLKNRSKSPFLGALEALGAQKFAEKREFADFWAVF